MRDDRISKMRNIGISAHIDSGKTTLTERILFYCKKIHAMHEVKGGDGVGATMDSMDLERERGITIQSAATNVEWKDHPINIIDTPGHVDFTIEVERALRVLDGAILVLCSVGGVQSQTLTVDKQLRRYGVPRLCFINKLDRTGANPLSVYKQLRERLGLKTVLLQLPIGAEDKLAGLIDLVRMKAVYNDGDKGEEIREEEIPADLLDEAKAYREQLLDTASLFSDELAEAFLEGTETEEMIYSAIRKGTISTELAPVLMGTAYKNKGIQLLLDAVLKYLPNPDEREYNAFDLDKDGAPVRLDTDMSRPTVALAFKLEESAYGQLTYVRLYQGSVKKGDTLVNSRTGRDFKVGRLMRMHAESREEIDMAPAGDIVAFFGIECASGDAFCAKGLHYGLTNMYVPAPVISLAISPKDKKSSDSLAKALNRFTKEDPTFRTHLDPESNETIIQGMGELHLDIYIERMRREYKVDLDTGMPQVAYRERIARKVEFDYTHKKQTGGSGQYGCVAGYMEPSESGDFEFVDDIRGGVIPKEFIAACEKGFRACLNKGSLIGFPVVGIRVVINDGNSHPVDSSDIAFQQAAIGAFRQGYEKAGPEILEPMMKVSVEGPVEFQGNAIGSLTQRRGMIISTSEDVFLSKVDAQVPLSEMFGYSTVLRSLTQGKSEFSMEFAVYAKVPSQISERLIEEFQEKKRAGTAGRR
jgi:elongation factor G